LKPYKRLGVLRSGFILSIHTNGDFTDWRDSMADRLVRRANPRFSFFADAEVTLGDGTSVRAQLAELSSRGCYIDTLEPIPTRTKLRLRICDGMNTCELDGKVLYLHSGGGFGIFGMGVLFEEMGADQHSSIDGWLRKLARHQAKNSGRTSSCESESKSHLLK
jgi:hypothetical protein